MVLYNLKVFFCKRNVRIFFVVTLVNTVVQILSRRYIKNYQELFKLFYLSLKIYLNVGVQL